MITFINKGSIDPRSITTFGVSSKESASAIGYFGTGLKYAIAILLREGCTIEIWTGGKQYTFATSQERIRLNDFNIITMNGQPLGFTTELGKNWKLWQAYRELYCNCVDEGGTIIETEDFWYSKDLDDDTVVVVSGTAFENIHGTRGEFILQPQNLTPIFQSEYVDVYEQPGKRVFYKGIAVASYDTLYTYNIKQGIDLTEDRTAMYTFQMKQAMARGIGAMTDEAHIVRAISCAEAYWEHSLTDFDVSRFSPEFVCVVEREIRQFNPRINQALRKTFSEKFFAEGLASQDMELSDIERRRLEKAIAFCKSIGFKVDECKIHVSRYLGQDVLGRAYRGEIYISNRTMMMGVKQVVATLIEEYLHCTQSLVDCTYQMQNYLFDQIVTLGERLTQEVL